MSATFTLSSDQQNALAKFKDFISGNDDVFILKGYAGTGKTTLIKHLIQWMNDNNEDYEVFLLASTGRAAKVLENKTGIEAKTVHGILYKYVVDSRGSSDQDDVGQLNLKFELKVDASKNPKLYIIDEASMISHLVSKGNHFVEFGSGNVMQDLFEFAAGQKIVFVGDPIQLPPPVGHDPFSPALSLPFLQKHFKVRATEAELQKIQRQKEGHSILDLATELRHLALTDPAANWEEIMNKNRISINKKYSYQQVVNSYLNLVGKNWDQAIILAHTNKQAFYYNEAVRKTIYGGNAPMEIRVGELLMVMQNSYLVPLANGDQVIIKSIKPKGKTGPFEFDEVEVAEINQNETYTTLIIRDFVFRTDANLDPEKQKALLIDFDRRARSAGFKRNSEQYLGAMNSDPYLNALRAKFGYAVTCNKAQGGEWPHVFISLSESLNILHRESIYRWLYTAVTRAQETITIKPIYKNSSY